jgi:hypothetical protein
MAKALQLTDDTMNAPPVPKAAQISQVTPKPTRKQGREVLKQEPREPLQVRWPGEDVKAVKLAALELDFPTVSDFMLACFHAYMKNHKKA